MKGHNYILQSLPLLASVLGDQYGVKVEMRGNEAKTDGKTIYIPNLHANSDADAIGLIRGYIDHEAAHVRYSNFKALENAKLDHVTHWLFNAIEDWRVERKLARVYPGCDINFRWMINRIFMNKDAEAGSQIPASDILNYVLFTVRSWDVLEMEPLRQDVRLRVDDVFHGLADEIDNVLEEVRQCCPDTSAAIDYAIRIAEMIRQWEPQSPQLPSPEESSIQKAKQRSDDNNSLDISDSGKNSDASSDCDTCEENSPKDKNTSDSQTNDADGGISTHSPVEHTSTATEPLKSIDDLFAANDDELPQSIGKMLEEEIEKVAESSHETMDAVAEECQFILSPMPVDEQRDVLKSSTALQARLHGLIQSSQRCHCHIGRRGCLDSAILHRLWTGGTKIFRSTSERKSINTAVHIVMDASFSMDGERMKLANQSCFALAYVLQRINGVNPAITAFQSVEKSGVMPILRHGQRLRSFEKAVADGGTPLGPALWWVMQQIVVLKETRKIILVLTDGAPDSLQSCLDAINTCSELGIEVYGIGIQSDRIKTLLPQTSRTVDKLQELGTAMFTILSKTLIGGAA